MSTSIGKISLNDDRKSTNYSCKNDNRSQLSSSRQKKNNMKAYKVYSSNDDTFWPRGCDAEEEQADNIQQYSFRRSGFEQEAAEDTASLFRRRDNSTEEDENMMMLFSRKGSSEEENNNTMSFRNRSSKVDNNNTKTFRRRGCEEDNDVMSFHQIGCDEDSIQTFRRSGRGGIGEHRRRRGREGGGCGGDGMLYSPSFPNYNDTTEGSCYAGEEVAEYSSPESINDPSMQSDPALEALKIGQRGIMHSRDETLEGLKNGQRGIMISSRKQRTVDEDLKKARSIFRGRSVCSGRKLKKPPPHASCAASASASVSDVSSNHRRYSMDDMNIEEDQRIRQGRQQVMVEIGSGVKVPYIPTDTILEAVQVGKFQKISCLDCGNELLCMNETKYVVCPDCRVVSPTFLDDADEVAGAGIKMEWCVRSTCSDHFGKPKTNRGQDIECYAPRLFTNRI